MIAPRQLLLGCWRFGEDLPVRGKIIASSHSTPIVEVATYPQKLQAISHILRTISLECRMQIESYLVGRKVTALRHKIQIYYGAWDRSRRNSECRLRGLPFRNKSPFRSDSY